MILWRIATETREFAADDLSGGGAAKFPGRWNHAGQALLYCCQTISLAVLETSAHIDDNGLPLNKFVVQVSVPDAVWRGRIEIAAAALPVTWNAIPGGRASAAVGANWLAAKRHCVLLVPSVIVPEERVALINPAHPDAATLSATVLRRFAYNALFRARTV